MHVSTLKADLPVDALLRTDGLVPMTDMEVISLSTTKQVALLSQRGRTRLPVCQLASIIQYVERNLLLVVTSALPLQIYRCL